MDRQHPAEAVRRERRITWSDPWVAAAAGAALSGLDHLRAMQESRLAPPPALLLLGAEMGEVEQGRVTMRLVPQDSTTTRSARCMGASRQRCSTP